MQVIINDIVRYLDSFRPDAVPRLRSAYPAARPILQAEGFALGGGDASLEAGVEAARIMLDSINDVAWDAVATTRSRLAFARRLELAGQLLSLAGFGILLKMILSGANLHENLIALVAAAAGLTATAIPLIVNFSRGTLIDGSGGLQSQYATLRDAVWDARSVRLRLDGKSANEEKRARVVDEANDIARRAYRILTDLGYSLPLSTR